MKHIDIVLTKTETFKFVVEAQDDVDVVGILRQMEFPDFEDLVSEFEVREKVHPESEELLVNREYEITKAEPRSKAPADRVFRMVLEPNGSYEFVPDLDEEDI